MRLIADLHIHSKYARACSKELTPQNLDLWARKKGIGLLGTGDFTHPAWFADLAVLHETKTGLYQLPTSLEAPLEKRVYFMYTAEVASIYKQGEKVRRVHNLIFASSREAAHRISEALAKRGCNLKSDGRPIIGLHCDELVALVKDADASSHVVPAHAWTPHFGVFGSLSGFNTLAEAFGDQTKHIWALETGLSSDPAMNWQVEALDDLSLISNSDPHSLHRLGREANIFNISYERLTYEEVIRVMRDKKPNEFVSTVEFFPEEGRYHLDGHADCKFSCEPLETMRLGALCPVCGKKLLRGVVSRVMDLSTRPAGVKPLRSIPFQNMVPLEEIIADCMGVGVASKKVQHAYEQALAHHTEFEVLLDLADSQLVSVLGKAAAESVRRVRAGQVGLKAGYDGVYGHVTILSDTERNSFASAPQATLF